MASNAQVLAELAEMRKAYALLVEAGQAKPTKVGPELIELRYLSDKASDTPTRCT